jgi:hypothetical protein
MPEVNSLPANVKDQIHKKWNFQNDSLSLSDVMAGLVPAIHALLAASRRGCPAQGRA